MLNFLTEFWVEPFINVPNGRRFFERHVPAEVIFIGSPIFNDDGTVTLGVADAGARITLTEVNRIDVEDQGWILRQLGTIYHEFAHIVIKRYNLPLDFNRYHPMAILRLDRGITLRRKRRCREDSFHPMRQVLLMRTLRKQRLSCCSTQHFTKRILMKNRVARLPIVRLEMKADPKSEASIIRCCRIISRLPASIYWK